MSRRPNSEPPSREDSAEALDFFRPETWGMSAQPDAFAHARPTQRSSTEGSGSHQSPSRSVCRELTGAFAIGGELVSFRILLFEL